MAQGTFTLFDEFSKSSKDGRIDIDSDTLKLALVTLQVGGTPTIAFDDAVPTWGAGGTTNLSTSEVSAGGGYTAGGKTLAGVTFVMLNGVSTLDSNNIVWTSSASGDPTDIKTAVLYSDTAANKDCIGYVDMTVDGTTAISLLAGDITATININGWLTSATR